MRYQQALSGRRSAACQIRARSGGQARSLAARRGAGAPSAFSALYAQGDQRGRIRERRQAYKAVLPQPHRDASYVSVWSTRSQPAPLYRNLAPRTAAARHTVNLGAWLERMANRTPDLFIPRPPVLSPRTSRPLNLGEPESRRAFVQQFSQFLRRGKGDPYSELQKNGGYSKVLEDSGRAISRIP